jgi:hypothetical protein
MDVKVIIIAAFDDRIWKNETDVNCFRDSDKMPAHLYTLDTSLSNIH